MWDTASYLLAMLSAYRLALISRDEFDRKLSQLLASLAKMPLFADLLPNKSYNTRSLAMVNYDNAASGRGIGWSAIDIGRLLVPLHIIVWHFPTHTEAIKAVMRRWASAMKNTPPEPSACWGWTSPRRCNTTITCVS
jgi:hypothetical protein